MKPEIGSKWRCTRDMGACRDGAVYTVTSRHNDSGWNVDGCGPNGWLEGRSFTDGLLIPLSPAPAEPAKAAGWKAGDRFTISGTVTETDFGVEWLRATVDGHVQYLGLPCCALRPEAAAPAAAPADDRHTFNIKTQGVAQRDAFTALGDALGLQKGHGFNEWVVEAAKRLREAPGAAVLSDDRNLRMQLADASSKRDQYEALSVKRELELGDKEREIARLRSALRDATAKLQRRGGI